MDNQRNDHIQPKRKEPPYKQLQSHNVPTNDMENTNGTNKGRDYDLLTSADCSLS